MSGRKVSYLSTAQLATLNAACLPIKEALGGVYLVGSATEKADYRDVDVRCIAEDETFDAIFGGRMMFWCLFCWAVSEWLSGTTGLPVDFQVQRQTEANEKHEGQRHALGLRSRPFAGGGDATNFYPSHNDQPQPTELGSSNGSSSPAGGR